MNVSQLEGKPELAVIGLGYVGLPLARAAINAGISVTGYDISKRTVDSLNGGLSHVDDVPDSDVELMLSSRFCATSEEMCLSGADVVVICVPTPLKIDGSPDLSPILHAVEAVARRAKQGALVILESTTFPGTTDDVVLPILSQTLGVVGTDFYLAFSPERVDPGNTAFGITNTPKIVGGVTRSCSAKAVDFYKTFVDDVIAAKGTKEAETAKLLENTYRHINIALINEMAKVCAELGVDIWDVIRCASTKPFGFHAFYPGPGVGGHCIPIDPQYLSYAARVKLGHPLKFVELAEETNSSMPLYVVERVQRMLNDKRQAANGARVLLVGVTYKANISDQRESPADIVAKLLMQLGAKVEYHDDLVNNWSPAGTTITHSPLPSNSEPFDVAVVLQRHAGLNVAGLRASATQIFDTRGTLVGDNVVYL